MPHYKLDRYLYDDEDDKDRPPTPTEEARNKAYDDAMQVYLLTQKYIQKGFPESIASGKAFYRVHFTPKKKTKKEKR